MLIIKTVWTIAKGEFCLMFDVSPIWIWSTVTAPNVSRKNIPKLTHKTGLRS